MKGLHLIADLHDCRCPADRLRDRPALQDWCVTACRRHGLSVVGQLFHAFSDQAGEQAGVTGAVVLAESHLTIHTWPEIASVTLDIYVCNYSCDNTAKAEALFTELLQYFAATQVERRAVHRGTLGA